MRKIFVSILAALGISNVHAGDFPPNVEMNIKTIRALLDAGSDPKKPHPLEHHFYCYSSDSLKALMEKGKSLGYRSGNVGEADHEGAHYWYGDLIRETVLDIKKINKENSIMLELAKEFNADYDGWGTPVVK